jgi:hypothetical protein
MLAATLVRFSRPTRYAAELQPVDMAGVHNWLRAQIAGQGMYHVLGQLGKHRQTERNEYFNLRDRLFDSPEGLGGFGELVTAPNAGEMLHRLSTVFAHPGEHLPAYTPTHEAYGATNDAMAEELHGRDWQELLFHMMLAKPTHIPGRKIKQTVRQAQDTGGLEPLLALQRIIPFSPRANTVPTRTQNVLTPFLQHQQSRRNAISLGLHQMQQPRQDRPMESVPEDYYAL